MRCSVNRLLQLATKPRLQSMRSDTISHVWPSASSKISRARRESSARSVRLLARRVSSISSEFDNVMASLMDAIIVYKWLLQSTSPAALAGSAHQRLRATPEQLCDALGACTELKPVYRRLLKMTLEHLQILEQQIGQLDQELATLLHPHQDAVQRLAEVPGFAVDSAQQIIAEVGPAAATFPSEKCLSSWVGACPGEEESAGVNYSHRSPKGNRHMRRLLNQTANAAVKAKGSIFEIIYRRCVPRLGHNQAIGAIAHRQCRLIWLILHQGARYEERGPAVSKQSRYQRTWRMIRQLRNLGYRIELPNPQASQAQA